MKRIGEKNILPNKCNKKHAANQESMKIDDDDVWEIIEEVHKKDKFDKEFDIGLIFEYEYGNDTSENEEDSSGDEL